jgi:hypothetical protein
MEQTHKGGKRYFTLEQANKMLPLVKAIVSDLVKHYGDLCERRDRLAIIRGRGNESRGPYREELDEVNDQLERDADRLKELVEELAELGVEFKDPNLGLVDFPALIEGREVYLCWKLGEPEVQFWHELEAGYQGRQPLSGDLASGIAQGASEQ